MPQYTALIPPDGLPPKPPGTELGALIFSTVMSLIFLALIGFICVDFIADYTGIPMPYDKAIDEALQAEYGPFISDFILTAFPGQYAPAAGKNARNTAYPLTAAQRQIAIQQLSAMFRKTEHVVVEFFRPATYSTDKFSLAYNKDIAEKLSAYAGIIGETSISPLTGCQPAPLVFTFYPSEIRIHVYEPNLVPYLHFSWSGGLQRWEGSFGTGLANALLDAPQRSGESVRSRIER